MLEDDFGRTVRPWMFEKYRPLKRRGLRYRAGWDTIQMPQSSAYLPWERTPFSWVIARNGFDDQIRTAQAKPVSRQSDQRQTIGLFHVEYYGERIPLPF